MDPDGTHRNQLTFSFGVDASPAWSPDGTQIAFIRTVYPDATTEIWVMNADGTNPVQLTSNGYNHEGLDWSPDGTKIAFSYDKKGNDIGYVPATGGDEVLMIGSSHL